MKKGCKCKNWLENIEILDSAMILYFSRNSKMLKKSFIYCPYCSKFIEEVEDVK